MRWLVYIVNDILRWLTSQSMEYASKTEWTSHHLNHSLSMFQTPWACPRASIVRRTGLV